ncbi:putative bifunctional diguanylate cyclase/phosphodiesterase [Blastococcus sp. SYSU D00695]
MDRQRWAVLAGTGAALAVCVVALVVPSALWLAEVVLAATSAGATACVVRCGWRRQRGARGWRLLAGSTLSTAVAIAAYLVVAPTDDLDVVLVRWVPAVPGCVLAVAGLLTLAPRERFRTGRRAVVEAVLFGAACLTGMQLLVFGPAGTWAAASPAGRAVLVAAVLTTASLLVAALVLLAAVESHRQPMALVLLAAVLLLAAGRGLGTSTMLLGLHQAATASLMLLVAGLGLLALAVTLDPGPGEGGARRPRSGRSVRLGEVLPHLAMLGTLLAVAVTHLAGQRASVATVVGSVACVALVGVHRWVAALDEARQSTRILRSEAWFREVVRSGGDGVLVLDPDLRITWTSPAVARMLGAGTDLTGRDLLTVTHPADVLPAAHALHPDGAGPGESPCGRVVLRLPHTDGSWRHVEADVADLRARPEVGALVLHCRDVTERHAREQALEDVAFTDPTTGLPNRAGFDRVLEQRLVDPAAPPATLLLVELDGLAEVREDAGRDMASSVLVELGRRLRTTVRGDEPVARLGGDAFAVLAEGDPRTGDLLADRCLSAVEQPLTTAAGVYDLTADIGLVPLEAGTALGEVWTRAEIAVRAARRAGRGSARRFDPALGAAAERRARLREDLPGACARGELSVAFQPVVSLAEQRIVGVEALLRWRHPELGDVPPREFVPIAERAGVIGDVQRWALEQAARAAVALPVVHAPLRLGVNISASHVAARTLVGDVAAALQCTGLPPERLILEITEATLLADTEAIAVDVEALRLMGVHVALDDFGTGHSTLAHLSALPIDVLKLDRDFVSRVDRHPPSRALCESVIAIGRALGVDVVAEGVETPAQLGVLRGLGCGFAQGFLLSRPLPLSELTALLQTGAGVLWPGLVGTR